MTVPVEARTCLGPYVVDAQLGHGGMGVVYRGTHAQTGASVAIKTVTDAEVSRLSQIRNEVEALRRLNHPGLVRVLDYGLEGGLPWYAMDLVEGPTLRDVIRTVHSLGSQHSFATAATLQTESGTLDTDLRPVTGVYPTLERRAELHVLDGGDEGLANLLGTFIGLCDTLAYVHGEGIVHRDLKPHNIFVTAHGRPVLVDFGLAAYGADVSGREVLDRDAHRGGSLHYMSPEQIRGEVLDPRCDLYALGCLLFEALTGRTPFAGRARDIMEQHQRHAPPPLRRFRPELPQRLERLIARLLAKERGERIGYARDVAVLLSECGARSPGWSAAPPSARTYLYRPPLVGRDDALGQLDRALRRVCRRHGEVIMVEGESGVGKTRFAMEVAQRAAQLGVRVMAGGCASWSTDGSALRGSGSEPLQALRPLLTAVADACIGGGADEAARLLGTFGPALAEFDPAIREFCAPGSLPPLPSSAARKRLYQALAHALDAVSRDAPVLLVLDDLQWADELSLGFLQHLAERMHEPLSVVLLATIRCEERTDEHAQLAATAGVRHILLPRLRADDVGQMVAGMLSLSDAPEAFIRFLSKKSEGNPFFVAEYLRTAVHEGVLVRDAGEWQVASASEPTDVICESLPLPQSLRDIVERRLRALPDVTAALMKLAAVAGREFDLELLQSAGSLLECDVVEALTELVSRHVVEPTGDGRGFRFAHDKLREIPYSELTPLERRRLHRQLAGALEARQDAGKVEPPAMLGLHWLGADEPNRAAPYLHEAGDAALRAHALDQAVELFRATLSALACQQSHPVAEITLLNEKLGDALAQKGAMLEARQAFDDAIMTRGALDHVDRARIHRKLGKTWEAAHDHQQELAAYDRAERELALGATRDVERFRSEWIQVKLNRTWVFYWQARIEDMNRILEELEPFLERFASPRQRSNFYQALVTRDYRRDRFVVSEATLQNARRSVVEAEWAKDPVEAALARFVLGFGLLFGGKLNDAKRELEGALQDARRIGNTTNEIRCLAYLLLAARWLQETDHTRALCSEVLERATAARMLDYVGLARACRGWLHFKAGDLEQAARVSRTALESWNALSFCYPFQWTALLTLLACSVGDSREEIGPIARQLLMPGLALLPTAIDSALRRAVEAHDSKDDELASAEASRAVVAAIAGGLL